MKSSGQQFLLICHNFRIIKLLLDVTKFRERLFGLRLAKINDERRL